MKKFLFLAWLVVIQFSLIATQTSAIAASYNVTTSLTDPTCDTSVGGYIDLESFGIYPISSLTGNSVWWNAFSSADPIQFFGATYTNGVSFTDDGFAFLAGNPGTTPGTPQALPNAAEPNALLAALWHDFEVVYDDGTVSGSRRGISLAMEGGSSGAIIIEYDGVLLAGTTDIIGDFEIIIDRRGGAKDIIFAYDNLNQALLGNTFTVGIENEAGDQAYTMINNAVATGVLVNGLRICFDAVPTYTIGGTVSGLAPGNSVVLQNNNVDDLTVNANGDFVFPAALDDGTSYAVTVVTQPEDPDQLCTVANGTGTIFGENITNVDVDCIDRFFWPMFLPAITNNSQL